MGQDLARLFDATPSRHRCAHRLFARSAGCRSLLGRVSDRLLISAMTIAELYAGVREGAERVALDDFIKAFEIVQIDNEIAVKGGLYRRDYSKTHGTGIGDAIIAATAELRHAELVTLNRKHFPMLSSVIVPYQKP